MSDVLKKKINKKGAHKEPLKSKGASIFEQQRNNPVRIKRARVAAAALRHVFLIS